MTILAIISDQLQSKAELWAYGIAFITPLIIQIVKKTVPLVPKWALPCLAPLVGLLLGLGLNAIMGANLPWIDGVLLGGLGVTIREIVNQQVLRAKQVKP